MRRNMLVYYQCVVDNRGDCLSATGYLAAGGQLLLEGFLWTRCRHDPFRLRIQPGERGCCVTRNATPALPESPAFAGKTARRGIPTTGPSAASPPLMDAVGDMAGRFRTDSAAPAC